MIDSGKKIVVGEKTFIVKKAPATVAYEVALRYKKASEVSKDEVEEQMACLNALMKYVEVDLGDGRTMALDSPSVINQHINDAAGIVEIQKTLMEVNFGFFTKGDH